MLAFEKKTRSVRAAYARSTRAARAGGIRVSSSRARTHTSSSFPVRTPAQAGDAFATSKLAVAVVKMCFEQRDMKQLNAQILVLSKRRGQLKQVSACPLCLLRPNTGGESGGGGRGGARCRAGASGTCAWASTGRAGRGEGGRSTTRAREKERALGSPPQT